jgi:hypothetical protein
MVSTADVVLDDTNSQQTEGVLFIPIRLCLCRLCACRTAPAYHRRRNTWLLSRVSVDDNTTHTTQHHGQGRA